MTPESEEDDDDALTIVDASLSTSVMAREAASSLGVSRSTGAPPPLLCHQGVGRPPQPRVEGQVQGGRGKLGLRSLRQTSQLRGLLKVKIMPGNMYYFCTNSCKIIISSIQI